jgi:hypothetical protein
MRLTTTLMLVLLALVPVRTSSAEEPSQKSATLTCAIVDSGGLGGAGRANGKEFHVKIDFMRSRLSIGVFDYEIISVNARSVVALIQEGDDADSGAELVVINRYNGSYQRSDLGTNVAGTQRLWSSGVCSPTPF